MAIIKHTPYFLSAFLLGVAARSFFDISENLVLVGLGLCAGFWLALSVSPNAQILQDLAQSGGTSRAIRQQADMRVLAKPGVEAKLLVINLIGQVFMHQEYASPFIAIDKILEKHKNKTPFIILDWHADATSEKAVMGRYLDGKVSAVFGTHTHVPTADAKILPKGTAYISDIGMVGPYESIIGVEIEPAIERFVKNIKTPKNPVETGPIEVNAIYLELEEKVAASSDFRAVHSEAARAVDIRHLRKIVTEYRI